MKVALWLSLIIIVSCNDIPRTGVGQESNTLTCRSEGVLCEDMTRWNLNSNKTNFPKRIEVIVNGIPVLNTCQALPDYTQLEVTLVGSERVNVAFLSRGVFGSEVDLEIIDLGDDCRNDAIFYAQTDKPLTERPLRHNYYDGKEVMAVLNN